MTILNCDDGKQYPLLCKRREGTDGVSPREAGGEVVPELELNGFAPNRQNGFPPLSGSGVTAPAECGKTSRIQVVPRTFVRPEPKGSGRFLRFEAAFPAKTKESINKGEKHHEKELPKVYEPQQVESDIYQMWMDGGCFKATPDPKKSRFRLSCHLPM